MAIKAIETVYNGYRFRSRLEARWAVFFDTLGVRYEYEAQGFDLADGRYWYLPDFWLPQQECWVEIKPELPTDDETRAKIRHLVHGSGKELFIFTGDVWVPQIGQESAWVIRPDGWDLAHWWCECYKCGRLGIKFEGRADRLPCGCGRPGDRGHNYDSPRLVAAYTAARQSRFEHGETPRPLSAPVYVPPRPQAVAQKFTPADIVQHPTFGAGIVLHVADLPGVLVDQAVAVEFESGAVKTLSARYAGMRPA